MSKKSSKQTDEQPQLDSSVAATSSETNLVSEPNRSETGNETNLGIQKSTASIDSNKSDSSNESVDSQTGNRLHPSSPSDQVTARKSDPNIAGPQSDPNMGGLQSGAMPSSYRAITGEPVKILEIDPESKQIIFYENELKEIFERNNALDKSICVCSIAGDYRKGKSFLLNYCLRFLMNNQDYLSRLTTDFNSEWLGNVDEPLAGFSWRSGVDLETTGIWIWSELFQCKFFCLFVRFEW